MAKQHKRKNHSTAKTLEPASKLSDVTIDQKLFPFLSDKNIRLFCLFLFLLVTVVFLPSLRGKFIEYDDNIYVVENSHVNTGFSWKNIVWSLQATEGENWNPLTWWSHMLDCQIYGLITAGHHLTNVAIHALNTVLVFLMLQKLIGAKWRSLIVAALFGLHPLRVQSVAWISERKDVLSVMFALLTILAYAEYVAESKGEQNQKSKIYYFIALVLFSCALMSKPMVVTLPCLLLLLDYWPLERWKQKRAWQLMVEKLPFFILAGAVSVVTYHAQKSGGSLNEVGNLSLAVRCETALVGYVCYLGKLFWPSGLCALYPHPGHWPIGIVFFSALVLSVISVLVFVIRRQRPYLFTGWFWYLGTLVPVIGFVQEGPQFIADRYTYFPCIGILIAVVWGLYEITNRWRYQVAGSSIATALAILLCVALTENQIRYWKDGATLWKRAAELTKDNYAAHMRLGRALLTDHRVDEALTEFTEVVKLRPNFAEARYFLADALIQKGRFDEAILQYQAILNCPQPNLKLVYLKLGQVYFFAGNLDKAIVELQKGLAIDPNDAGMGNILGVALLHSGHRQEAINQFQMSLKSPSLTEEDTKVLHHDLGTTFFKQGKTNEAIHELAAAVKLRPDFINHHDLGVALGQGGYLNQAILQFQLALKLKPDDSDTLTNLNLTIEMKAKWPLDRPIPQYQINN